MKTEPKSTVALSIIDKSVELMGNLNDLTTSQISAQMSLLQLGPYYGGRPIPDSNANSAVVDDMSWWGGGYWEKPQALTDLNVI